MGALAGGVTDMVKTTRERSEEKAKGAGSIISLSHPARQTHSSDTRATDAVTRAWLP
jgi:hypothetical protein